jgi:hypothetical protein
MRGNKIGAALAAMLGCALCFAETSAQAREPILAPEWAARRIPADAPPEAFAPLSAFALSEGDEREIDIYLPSLEIAEGPIQSGAAVWTAKARYRRTGIVTAPVCAQLFAEVCPQGAALQPGAPAYFTRRQIESVHDWTDTWCALDAVNARPVCVYVDSARNPIAYLGDHRASFFMPYLPSSYEAPTTGMSVRATAPMQVAEEPVDFGEDMTIVLQFEDFDRREADLKAYVFGRGVSAYFRPLSPPRDEAGVVRLPVGVRALQLTQGASRRDALVSPAP